MPAAKRLVLYTQLNSDKNDEILCFLQNGNLILIYGEEGDLTWPDARHATCETSVFLNS